MDLHNEHMGIARMKATARRYFWWPKLDEQIETMVSKCVSCQENATLPRKQEVAKWDWPTGPWRRIHIDYAGPFMGKMFLVVVDAYSKWLEVCITSSSTSETTIRLLRRTFATHGLPEHLVSDNGTQFCSEEFQNFMKANGVRHTKTAPGHPATNGLAERYVGFIKTQLKKNTKMNLNLEDRLQQILFTYRVTPHSATGETPAELLPRILPRKHPIL